MKENRVYRLVDKNGNILFQGTYDECIKREFDKLEYVGISTPVYKATNDNGLYLEGTMKELSEKLNESYLNLYNYTRYKRKCDGLFISRIGDDIV